MTMFGTGRTSVSSSSAKRAHLLHASTLTKFDVHHPYGYNHLEIYMSISSGSKVSNL